MHSDEWVGPYSEIWLTQMLIPNLTLT